MKLTDDHMKVLAAIPKAAAPKTIYIADVMRQQHAWPTTPRVLAKLKGLEAAGLVEREGVYPHGCYGYRWALTAAGRSALSPHRPEGITMSTIDEGVEARAQAVHRELREEAATLSCAAWRRNDGGAGMMLSAAVADRACDVIDDLLEALSAEKAAREEAERERDEARSTYSKVLQSWAESRQRHLAAETAHLRERVKATDAENTRLRAALALSDRPCAYCTLPADKWSECKHGFPGCDRADDAMGCPELGAAMERDALRERVKEMEEALEPFANDAPRHGTAADDTPLDSTPYEKRSRLTVGDLRRAAAIRSRENSNE